MSSAQISGHRPPRTLIAGSWIAVFVPLLSLGLLTAVLFAIAAAAVRSRALVLSAIAYAVVTAIAFVALNHNDAIFGIAILILMVGGTGHAAWVRNRVVGTVPQVASHGQQVAAPKPPMQGTMIATDPAVQAVLYRRARRDEARQLLSTDPNLATELAIGRPDRQRGFDDGGLVDANNVPEAILAQLPGVTAELATKIATASKVHRLASVEDLIVFADLPYELAENLREYLIFRERY